MRVTLYHDPTKNIYAAVSPVEGSSFLWVGYGPSIHWAMTQQSATPIHSGPEENVEKALQWAVSQGVVRTENLQYLRLATDEEIEEAEEEERADRYDDPDYGDEDDEEDTDHGDPDWYDDGPESEDR